jgi:uncharacterized protein YegL
MSKDPNKAAKFEDVQDELALVEFAANPDPRCPCVLILDTSASMSGLPIAALNGGLQTFQQDISKNTLAQRRVEIAIVSFGAGGPEITQDFITAGQFNPPHLQADGSTPIGGAIHLALDLLHERKTTYKLAGVPYYRPWIFMITDGQPTDAWEDAAQRIRNEENNKSVAFFTIGVEGANMELLRQIATRQPLKLKGLQFTELFVWLSQSQQRVSASKPGDQVALLPPGWAEV